MNAPNDLRERREHRRVPSDDQLAAYRSTGFLTMRNCVDRGLLERLIAVTDRLWDEGRGLWQKTAHYDLEPAHTAESPRIRRIASPTELDRVFIDVEFDSVLGDIAADLAGGPVKFYHSKITSSCPAAAPRSAGTRTAPCFRIPIAISSRAPCR